MKIGAPKESASDEARVAMTPQSAKDLQKLGHECLIEKGAGVSAGFDDAAYEAAGVKVVTAATLWKNAEIIAKVRPPTDAEGRRPIDPASTEVSSVRISPNIFSVTMTSNDEGRVIRNIAAASI